MFFISKKVVNSFFKNQNNDMNKILTKYAETTIESLQCSTIKRNTT